MVKYPFPWLILRWCIGKNIFPRNRLTDFSQKREIIVTDPSILALPHARGLLVFLLLLQTCQWISYANAKVNFLLPRRLIVIFCCWTRLVEKGNTIFKIPSTYSSTPIPFFIILSDCSVHEVNPRTYLFLTIQFLVLIGNRKGKLGFLFVTRNVLAIQVPCSMPLP